MKPNEHSRALRSRRDFLLRGTGLDGLALSSLLSAEAALAAPGGANAVNPLASKPPHHAPTAKSVIWLFMEGGPSHIDLFDPKPALERLAGQPVPPSYGKIVTAMGTANNTLMPSKRKWKQYGQSGLWVSDWYSHMAKHADDLTLLRSCWADGLNHVGSVCQMNTGSILGGRPSMGAWTQYGLGAANQDLPAFVVLADEKPVTGGPKNWSSGFLPATYQGTLFRRDGAPILYLDNPESVSAKQQRSKLDLIATLNRQFAADKPEDTDLQARLNSYELAYRMQAAAPEAVDLSKESDETKRLYGIDEPHTAKYGTNLLLARRLVERGVRFVEAYSGSGSMWDSHTDMEGNHGKMCRSSDKPIAGLLSDLKARGLLDETLVVWGGEFGRTPFYEAGDGRDHNPWGFSMWMAGGGVKPGQTIGTTDEIGLRAVDRPIHVHDIHATILHLLGLNHLQLTYLHNGRSERPTLVAGNLIQEIYS
ncbi:MAG: DUF1501 domain-containing protein [Acidobacteria bacterium]|nr:DUF1501 domain-containing protein [Acidobacteriota bacterium]